MRLLSILSFFLAFICTGCNKENTPDSGDDTTPYVEFNFKGQTTRVNCEKIVLEAGAGSDVSSGGGTSASTGFFFNFSFPSKSSKIDLLSPGLYPLKSCFGYYAGYDKPEDVLQYNFQFPSSPTKEDYYRSVEAPIPASNAGENEPRHEVTKISKGGVENNRQTYIVEGKYVAQVILKNQPQNPAEMVTGSYRLKLHTLPE
jgi:hypothetical protein